MAAPHALPNIPLPSSPIMDPSTPTSTPPPDTFPSPSLLAPPSSSSPTENPPPLTPTSDTSTTLSTDTTDTETFGELEDDFDLMTANTRTMLSNILATTQAQSKIARAITTHPKPEPNPADSEPHDMEAAPQALEPLWRDPTLGKLIGRLIETQNLTRGSGGDEGDVRGREVQQVKALRGVIGELVEWDREVLAVREWVWGWRGGIVRGW
ncbi:MAG: hypothetical protein L6R42_010122 [Xanthoria sp. 1 TBL-2021]|nr:MAG: hypothetical protein L6R42_010122 [Xanthoria sp. 1 TBL-2021]